MCMALDILSRSLRRSSFYPMIAALMGFQLCMVVCWKLAVFGANSFVWLLIALVAGKWLTGTVARILGLIASGGIASWFAQQSILMAEIQHMQASQHSEPTSDDASADYDVGYNTRPLPEEYGTADASVYQSVLDMDEGIDDEFEVEDGNEGRSTEWTNAGGSTVKAFFLAAVTISFGSVAQWRPKYWTATMASRMEQP